MRRLVGIMQSLTPARIKTLAGVYFGYGLSILLRRPIVISPPSFITVEPVCGCNLQCPECPVGTGELGRRTGMIELDVVDSILESFGRRAIWVNLYFQGEPFLHPKLHEIVERFSSQRIFTSVSTNGLLLTPEIVDKILLAGLKEIIFSVDGASEEEYLAYRRGGSFQTVVENIRLVVAKRKGRGTFFPRIVYQTLVTSSNENNLDNIQKFAYKLGVDTVDFKTLNLHHGVDSNKLLPSTSKLSRYTQVKTKRERSNACFRLWSNAVISFDGRLALCCMDKEVAMLYNVNIMNLSEAWMSLHFNGIRNGMVTGSELPNLCKSCSLKMR